MKKVQSHIIKRQSYEITLDNESNAYAYQNKISYVQGYQVNLVLQKVMDQYSKEEYLDQFDEVLLDLGTISPNNFEKEIVYKVEEALSTFLKNNVFENGTLKTGKRIQLYDKKIEQLEFFLKNGYVNWNVGASQKPVELVKELLSNHRDQTIQLLKTIGKKEAIRKRLITQMEDTFLEEIVIGVTGHEGEYINKYRQNLIEKQKREQLVETNSVNFRSATWEITLAYIFVESSGFYNQKNFLKLLIYKIAQKYRVTYQKLLHTLIYGVQNQEKQRSWVPEFEKLLTILQNEEKQKEPVIHKNVKERFLENRYQNFTELLQYYITYNSLPAEVAIDSTEHFHKILTKYVTQHSSEFQDFLDSFIQNKSNANLLIQRFSNEVLYTMMQQSKNDVISKLLGINERILKTAKTISNTSLVLDTLKKNKGNIVLRTYISLQSNPGILWEEFLFQTAKLGAIDNEFVTVLEYVQNDVNQVAKEGVNRWMSEIVLPGISVVDAQEIIGDLKGKEKDVAEKIYLKFNNKKENNLQQYFLFLKKNIHQEDAIKLTANILELCEKSRNYTVKEITKWTVDRLNELSKKQQNIKEILGQTLQIMNWLGIQSNIYLGVDTAQIQLDNLKNNSATDEGDLETPKYNIPETVYKKMIKRLNELLYRPERQDITEALRKVFEVFSKMHKVTTAELKEGLRKHIANRNDVKFIKKIVEEDGWNEYDAKNTKTEESITYRRDFIQHYVTTGRIPWWSKDISLVEIKQYVREMVERLPAQFVSWLKKAKNPLHVLQLTEEPTYMNLLSYVNSNATNQYFKIIEITNKILDNEVSSLGFVTQKARAELRSSILAYIVQNQSSNRIDFMKYMLQKIEDIFSIPLENTKIWIWEQMREDHSLKEPLVFDFLEKEIKKLDSSQNDIKRIVTSLDKAKDWDTAINLQPKRDIIPKLIEIYRRSPDEIRFNLKRTRFRKRLLHTLNQKEQITLIKELTKDRLPDSWSKMVVELEKIKKHITTSQYQKIRKNFTDKILLYLSVNQYKSWHIDDWSALWIQSVYEENKEFISNVIPKWRKEVDKNLQPSVQKKLEKIEKVEKEIIPEEENASTDGQKLEEEQVGEAIYVENSGIIILGPYIALLFERLGLVENQEFKSEEATQKGIHILQYAITGKEYEEEQLLILNKIVCGVDIHTPIAKEVILLPEDKELVNSLLKAIISSWSVLKNTTVEGLRETFLCRGGRLTIEEDSYVLTVEQKPFDMLLDQIPWSITKLKLTWMKKMLEVLWRPS